MLRSLDNMLAFNLNYLPYNHLHTSTEWPPLSIRL